MSRPTTSRNPNEDRELMEEYKKDRPNHTAYEWILEALYINNESCSDNAIAVANFLYLAIENLEAHPTGSIIHEVSATFHRSMHSTKSGGKK
jgi:hypothetical protein